MEVVVKSLFNEQDKVCVLLTSNELTTLEQQMLVESSSASTNLVTLPFSGIFNPVRHNIHFHCAGVVLKVMRYGEQFMYLVYIEATGETRWVEELKIVKRREEVLKNA